MKAPYRWALAVAAVLLLGVISLQVTYAAWTSSDSAPGDSVSTGHLRIAGEGDAELNLTGLTKENMNTGDQVQLPLTVVNDSTVAVGYRLRDVAVVAGGTPPPLDLRIAKVTAEVECPAEGGPTLPGRQVYSGGITAASTTETILAEGASDILCLTATAQPVGPEQKGRYVFTFHAAQR